MSSKDKDRPILLRWSEYIASTDMQDPLGLGLRGIARLSNQLLFCITSITPRARYFSFIPWCVYHYRKFREEEGSEGLWGAIRSREKGLTVGCIAHHDGKPCSGGALIGSTVAVEWYKKPRENVALKDLELTKQPALNAYLNSLVNLNFFVATGETPDSDDATEGKDIAFENLQLTDLGRQVAESYERQLGNHKAIKALGDFNGRCFIKDLRELGRLGGLCELKEKESCDRDILTNIFFAREGLKEKSHAVRQMSLLLILELSRQLECLRIPLDGVTFASAVYFDEVVSEDEARHAIVWPQALEDVKLRWRMFYFHYYMAVALEGMFSWLMCQLNEKGLQGKTRQDLLASLNMKSIGTTLGDLFECRFPKVFGSMNILETLSLISGIPQDRWLAGDCLSADEIIDITNVISENRLETFIRDDAGRESPASLAIPLLLFALVLIRYQKWHETSYGRWIAGAANDPFLDLMPPVLIEDLSRRFGDWWKCSWNQLAEHVLSRYVIQVHQALAYEKSAAADRCLLQVEGDQVIASGQYDKVGIRNARFFSAFQILIDLSLLKEREDGLTVPTGEGLLLINNYAAGQGA